MVISLCAGEPKILENGKPSMSAMPALSDRNGSIFDYGADLLGRWTLMPSAPVSVTVRLGIVDNKRKEMCQMYEKFER